MKKRSRSQPTRKQRKARRERQARGRERFGIAPAPAAASDLVRESPADGDESHPSEEEAEERPRLEPRAVARRGRRSARGSDRGGTDEAPAKPATVQETARLVSARSRADTIKLALAGVGVIAAVIGLVVVSRRQNAADQPVTSAAPAPPPAPIAAPPAGLQNSQSGAGSASAMRAWSAPATPTRASAESSAKPRLERQTALPAVPRGVPRAPVASNAPAPPSVPAIVTAAPGPARLPTSLRDAGATPTLPKGVAPVASPLPIPVVPPPAEPLP
jgi:hypothetical protein